jgi:hypothetical protein
MGILRFLFSDNESKTADQIIESKPMKIPTVEEIHRAFYEDIDTFVLSLQSEKPDISIDKELYEKGKLMFELGFRYSKESKIYQDENRIFQEKETDYRKKLESKNFVDYLNFKYPQYRIISKESVEKLCEKYNLVFADSNAYTGTIPNRNLKEISNFKIKDEDKSFEIISESRNIFIASYQECIDNNYTKGNCYINEMSFYIVAPKSDMRYGTKTIDTFKVEDPIVLYPVFRRFEFSMIQFFLIVSAWGNEASDENVVNFKNN